MLCAILGGFVWIVLARQEIVTQKVPVLSQSLVLLWGLLFLPFVALPSMLCWLLVALARRLAAEINPHQATEPPAPDIGRRQLLGSAAVALPVLATFGTAAFSFPQRNRFRIREITVPIRDLPADLHGLRIAHVSDTHVGKFTSGKVLHELAEATNRLKADLVLLTGDLIDQSLSDLPEALDMVSRLDPRSGLYLIEGNHDLFQGAEEFAQGVMARGFHLLRDEIATLQVKGHPLDLLGIRWNKRGTSIDPHVDTVFAKRNPDALPILLAHHPHAFDRAADLGIPLTLAGHTHGGQLMVTPEIGAGPMLYKYWSGLYQKQGSSLVVSNGAGNWFPLRTSAPAEIVHIKLIRQA
jgi:predicted MPP superfamily phosphohydrolase